MKREFSTIEQDDDMFTLRDFLSDKAPDVADMRQVFLPVMKQLALLHQRGLVHRAVNPDTIYRDDAGQWRLFALSELPDGDAPAAEGDRRVPLTNAQLDPDYAPIELFSIDVRRQGPWTDIYSLGAVLYLCAAGHSPVGAKDRVITGEPYDKSTDPLLWLSSTDSLRFDKKFARLVDRALTYFHYDRPQTIESWAAAIFGNNALANTKLPVNRLQRKRPALQAQEAPLLTDSGDQQPSEAAPAPPEDLRVSAAAPDNQTAVKDAAQDTDHGDTPTTSQSSNTATRSSAQNAGTQSAAVHSERTNESSQVHSAPPAAAPAERMHAGDVEESLHEEFYADDEFTNPDLFADESPTRYAQVDRSQRRLNKRDDDEGGWLAAVAGAVLLIIGLMVGIMFVNNMSLQDVITIVKEEAGLAEPAPALAPAPLDPSALPGNVQFSDPVEREQALGSGAPDTDLGALGGGSTNTDSASGTIDRESGFPVDTIETGRRDESVESIVSFGQDDGSTPASDERQLRRNEALLNLEARSAFESSEIRNQDDESSYQGPNLSQTPLRAVEAEAVVRRFRSALEALDLGTINRIARLSERRHTYLNYLIESFVSSKVIGEVVELEDGNTRARARLMMTELTDPRGERSAPPAGLREITIEVLRGRDGQPVIHWQ